METIFKHCFQSLTIVALAASLAFPQTADLTRPVLSYSGRMATLQVKGGRCLYLILLSLSRLYGWRITYEDAPLVYRGDLIDATAPSYVPKDENDRALFPRGGLLAISFEVPGVGQPPAKEKAREIVTNVLNTYEKNGFPGRYRLEVSKNGIMHVIPTEMKNREGVWSPVVPILDREIKLEAQPNSNADQVIGRIIRTLSQSTGFRIIDGPVADNKMHQTKITSAVALQGSARDVIDSVAIESGAALGWLLLYDPGLKWYALNIVH